MLRHCGFRRGLVTLLVLLLATPQMLLRPCCCTQAQANSGRVAAAEAVANPRHLPPCCLKRLQAAQKLASAGSIRTDSDSRPGMTESGRCGCKSGAQIARTGRVIVNESLLRLLATGFPHPMDRADHQPVLTPSLKTAARTAWPDSGLEHCARLCRWLV